MSHGVLHNILQRRFLKHSLGFLDYKSSYQLTEKGYTDIVTHQTKSEVKYLTMPKGFFTTTRHLAKWPSSAAQ